MDKLDIVKGVAGLIASTGVSTVVGHAIKHTTPEDLKITKKIAVFIGAAVLTGVAGTLAADYVEKRIDAGVAGYKKGREMAENLFPDTQD